MKYTFRSLCLLSTLILAITLPAQAQRRTPALPTSRNAAAEVATPAVAEVAEVAENTAVTPVEPQVEDPDVDIGTLVLIDESALQVIDLLEKMTGKIILRRQDISPSKINFNSRGPLKKGDAILALESLLTLNGIMLTDMGGRFMKAVPATDVNRHVPEMIIGSTLELQPSQQIYAKLFQFQYLNAEQTSGSIISPLLSQNSSFVAFPKSNALLITDALINLQRIESIVNEADRAQDIREDIKFIKLEYVQATEMQERIENLIQGPLKSYLEGNTSVTADERTNQLILITHTGNIDTIMSVIESIDVDAAPLTASEVFPLRQAKAEEVVPIIENIISGQKEGREEDAKVAKESNNNSTNNSGNIVANDAIASKSSSDSSSSEANSSLQFSNFVGLSADDRTNAIVAYGTHNDLKTIKELIEKIDVPLPQVRIEAIITEVTLNENQSSGISSLGFTVTPDGDVSFGGKIETGGDDNTIVETLGGVIGTGFNLTGSTAADATFTALLSASDTDSDVRVLSAPTIVVSHNEEGVINVSESRPIITGSSSTLNDNSSTNVRSNVEFRDIGIQLTVTPLIGSDGSVQMTVEQVVDNITGETTIDGNVQPIIGRREANSTITVNNRGVIILGGLQENRKNDSNAYFPLLGKLPGVNKVFGGESTEYIRTELVIFIRPTILKTPEDANAMSEEKIKVIKEGPAVTQFVNTGSVGDLYMDGSSLEDEEPKQEATEKPTSRSLHRLR